LEFSGVAMPSVRKPATKRRTRGTRAQTRARLLQAALDLLEAGGESAVTTVGVTQKAGIAQSAFYQHFANVEECLAAVAEQITSEIRTFVAEARRKRVEAGLSLGDQLEESFRNLFKLASRERSIHRLFLRYRSDRVSLKGVMYRFARGLGADLAKHLTERARQAGRKAPPAEWIEATADNLVAVSHAAIEAHLDGRGPSPEVSAQVLAAFTRGAWRAVLDAMPPA
jgi:TetR/AcrR family transcriptional regulator, fatty acid biosynthesis regulator